MRHSSRDVMVGLCSIVGLAGMATLLLSFGELSSHFTSRYELKMSANTAMGLRAGSQVMLEGVPIGEVETIEVDASKPLPVQLVLMVDRKVALPASARAGVTSGLLGGGARIDFRMVPGAPTKPIDPANPPVMEARFTSIGDQIESILAQVNEGEGTLGRLVKDPQLYDDLREASQRLAITLRELQSLVARVKEEGLELKF